MFANVLLEIVTTSEAFVTLSTLEELVGRRIITGRLVVALQMRLSGKAFVTVSAFMLRNATFIAVLVNRIRAKSVVIVLVLLNSFIDTLSLSLRCV